MSEDNNPREELYRRFRQSLSRPVSERYFDEDELVEIYDYAGDISDDYVQTECLFCGARLYPESQALSERRALLYLDTSIDDSDKPSPAAGAYLADNPDVFSPIFDIARLELNRPEDPEAALEFLLTQYDTFNDEEIIRFVDLAFDLDQYKWVVENLDRLRAKISFQPVLSYEVMQEADDMLDNELMAKLAEELIENEPFAPQYWISLFKAQARMGKDEDAKATFDSARALAADEPDSLMVLVDAAYNFAPYLYQESFEILEGLKTENPDEFMYTDCQCALLVRSGASDRAIRLLKKYLKEHPGNQKAMRQLLLCNTADARQYLNAFYDATDGKGFDDDIYAELVNTLSVNSSSQSLIALLRRNSIDNTTENSDICAWAEALFSIGKFSNVTALIDGYLLSEQGKELIDMTLKIPLKGTSLAFAYMVSLMKLGRGDAAETFWNGIRPFMEQLIEDAPMPIRMSVRCLFTLADKMRRHPADDTLYWENFDMLYYGKN